MSLVIRPDIPLEKVPLLSLVTGYAVASAVRSATGLPAHVKWPNDVLVNGKKVCGILCETRMDVINGGTSSVIVGIGINANQEEADFPDEIRSTATSLRIIAGHPVDRDQMIAQVLNVLETALDEFAKQGLAGSGLLDRLMRMTAYVGEIVTLGNKTAGDHAAVTGVFRGIDPDGRALIEIPGEGVEPFSAGDLSLRPISIA